MTSTQKEIRDLCNDEFLFAMIVPGESGIIYRQQAGGVCCDHPEVEGRIVRFPCEWLEGARRLDVYDAEQIEEFLYDVGLDEYLEPDTGATEEAWVYCKVRRHLPRDSRKSGKYNYFEGLEGQSVILTYTNSD